MADKYYRLVCFVVDICSDVLREYFVKLAKNDAGSSYTTVDAYLAVKRPDVIQLCNRKTIRRDQYNLLYPGHGTTDETKWDVTLLVTLITELFASRLKPLETIALKDEIRGIRNELQHYPNTANMSDDYFDDYWSRLDTAVVLIATNVLDPNGMVSLRDKINEAKCNNLPNIGDCLRCWYEERIKRYEEKIDQLESELSEVKSNTKETNDILRQVTVQKPGPSGDKDKRIKVTDNILARLQANFESTMNELSNDFNEPNEVSDIRTKLRECHHVVVTGSNDNRYLEAALAAIRGMGYNYKRSVEMNTSCDWRHVDPKDVDLVVCRDPFGSFSYDESKAKATADIFNSMMHSTRGADGDKTLDIIIVTDLKILEECMMHHDHDILEEVVKVFTDTSLTRPADLTTGCKLQMQNMSSSSMPLSRNLGVMTSNFLSEYMLRSRQVDNDVLRKAKEKLKASKAIVITGQKKCGKTSIAVALASSYEPSHCLLLKKPSDVDKIDFPNICLVIIDEFAGKYRFEENDVYKWYNMFDHLYSAVIAGQMNVIITCEKGKLDKCVIEIARHAILDNVVEVSTRTNVVKQEKGTESLTEREQYLLINNSEQTGRKRRTQNQTVVLDEKRPRSSSSREWTVKTTFQSNVKMNGEEVCVISGSCSLPSGEILLLNSNSHKLIKLDSRYKLISALNYTDGLYFNHICCTGSDEVVVSSMFDKKLFFVDTSHDMKLVRWVDTEHYCYGLACHAGTIYLRDVKGSVYKYDTYGILQHLYTNSGSTLSSWIKGIAVSDDGRKLYIAANDKLVTIDNNGKVLFTLKHPNIRETSAVCVDNQDHIFVSVCNQSILQISADGKRIVGVIRHCFVGISLWTMLFDRKNTALVVAGTSNSITVLNLELK